MINRKVFLFKKRRENDTKSYYSKFVTIESGFIVYLDSFREIRLRIFLLHILKKILKFKTVLLLSSLSSSISASISLRKPLKPFSIWVSQKLFPNNLQHTKGGVYGFYDFKIIILLFLLRNNKFNPWYEGCSKYVDIVYSRYPILSKEHEIELKKYQSKIIFSGEFFVDKSVQTEKTKNTLFAMPQFYEQGIMSREKSNLIILRMLKFIEEKDGEFPDIILHPRMNKKDYKKYSSKLYQNNLTELLPHYKNYYTINSSTIFLAMGYKCDCFVFKVNELDYSFIDLLTEKYPINFIKF